MKKLFLILILGIGQYSSVSSANVAETFGAAASDVVDTGANITGRILNKAVDGAICAQQTCRTLFSCYCGYPGYSALLLGVSAAITARLTESCSIFTNVVANTMVLYLATTWSKDGFASWDKGLFCASSIFVLTVAMTTRLFNWLFRPAQVTAPRT
jgi:hypothetical protein